MWTKIKSNPGLTALVLLSAILMTAAAWVDRSWTRALGGIVRPGFEEIMGRSIFEGEGLGINDLALLMLLSAIGVYCLACRRPANRRRAAWRPQAGFILVSGLVIGVYFVHSLKWIMGRARPELVIEKGLAFSHWFAFGPHFVTRGIYSGSFPSGHTAQMFLLMALAYVLAGDPGRSAGVRLAGWLWGAVALTASLAMGLARCMSLSHWLTDVLGSILGGWILMHLLYHHVLRVPDQHRFVVRHGQPPRLPAAWEIVLCTHWLIGILGLMGLALALRALLLQTGWGLLALLPAGLAALWFARRRSTEILYRVWQANEEAVLPRSTSRP